MRIKWKNRKKLYDENAWRITLYKTTIVMVDEG